MTVIDLLKMHCLEDSYIVAGLGGQHRTVKRIDFLENPFPDVKMYMELDEFIFTTFFNMKDDKANRIALVQYMIDHGSAGIAILPANNLNDNIDQEILDLGNRYDFPIVYIPNTVRYSDIIEGYSLLNSHSGQSVSVDGMYFEIMKEISDFHLTKNIDAFCNVISGKLNLPIIVIGADNAVSTARSDPKIVTLILSKISEIRTHNQDGFHIPVSVYVTKEKIAIFSFQKKATVVTYLEHFQLQDSNVRVFRKISPILAQELQLTLPDTEETEERAPEKAAFDGESENYLVVLRKSGISKLLPYFEKHFSVYYENAQSEYVVIIVRREENNVKSIFTILRELVDKTDPQLLIFSRALPNSKEFENQTKLLSYVLPDLLFLQGIFLIDELPTLYIMLFSPYDFKEILYSVLEWDFARHVKPSFFDTLRLYLLINNISDVSDLLGIHANSVKYQIHKCFEECPAHLAELPALKLLTNLELAKVENFRRFQS